MKTWRGLCFPLFLSRLPTISHYILSFVNITFTHTLNLKLNHKKKIPFGYLLLHWIKLWNEYKEVVIKVVIDCVTSNSKGCFGRGILGSKGGGINHGLYQIRRAVDLPWIQIGVGLGFLVFSSTRFIKGSCINLVRFLSLLNLYYTFRCSPIKLYELDYVNMHVYVG